MTTLINDPRWWTTLAETPMLLLLAWMVFLLHRLRSERTERTERHAERGAGRESDALDRTRDDLSAFKLEVARTYVPLSLIRDVDQRLTQQLMRIEAKLDEAHRTATVAQTVAQSPARQLFPLIGSEGR